MYWNKICGNAQEMVEYLNKYIDIFGKLSFVTSVRKMFTRQKIIQTQALLSWYQEIFLNASSVVKCLDT